MPIFKKNKTETLFIHIPKCAGTSIENAFIENGYEYDWLIYPARDNVPDILPCNPQHYHRELIDNYLENEISGIEFTVVRNPLHRLISEFQWSHNARVEAYDDNFFRVFDSVMSQRMSEFLIAENHFKTNKKVYLNRQFRFPYDNHMRPQVDFVRENTTVLKLEEETLPFLEEHFGITKLNKDNDTLSLEKPNKFKGSDRFQDLYTKLYFADHEKFDYEKPF